MIETQVAIIGAGPCGLTLANLLGVYGIDAVVIDRSSELLDYPRAVGIDDEALRTLQIAGLADRVLRDMIRNVPLRYHNSRGECFAQINPAAWIYGWPRRSVFLQPLFEKTLRQELPRFPTIRLLLEHELTALESSEPKVSARVRRADGEEVSLRCDYLVGADGGRSTVRRLLNIDLLGKTNPTKWLVVDADSSSIDQPYSAVYCDPDRPYIAIDLPYRHRRWEFMLMPGDDEEKIQTPDSIARLMAGCISSGQDIRVKRSRVYTHHSRIAAHFSRGRAFLAGDAAHLMPPFFGQGMNSGLRDAANLSWKLAAVLQRGARPELLETYDSERREHARQMIELSTLLGRLFTPRSKIGEVGRHVFFKGIQKIPGMRDYIFQMRFKPMPRYKKGFVSTLDAAPPVGTMFPQPTVTRADGSTCLLDDLLGSGFALLGYKTDPTLGLPQAARDAWTKAGAKFVHIHKPRNLPLGQSRPDAGDSEAAEDLNGTLRDWFQDKGENCIVVLRPDRYIAAITSPADLPAVTADLQRLLF